MSTISQEESLLLQCLATTSLLGELSNANFLESDYYKQLSFSNKNIKNILTQFGLRNPATMQMMLYALLTVPRETLPRTAYSVLETYVERINPLVSTLIETETISTYDNEDSCEKIDYFRHIRNAVAHSKCNYFSDRGKNFVIFSVWYKWSNELIYWVIKTGLNRKNHTCIWYFVHSGIFILNYSDNSNFYLLI